MRRDEGGKFKESDDVGRSLAADRRKKAKKAAKPGQGIEAIGRPRSPAFHQYRERGTKMLKPENEVDKERFEKLKDVQVDRGRSDQKATEVAAEEVKEMRRREGRSKEE